MLYSYYQYISLIIIVCLSIPEDLHSFWPLYRELKIQICFQRTGAHIQLSAAMSSLKSAMEKVNVMKVVRNRVRKREKNIVDTQKKGMKRGKNREKRMKIN